MKNEFLIAITQVCAERRLPKEVVLDAIEQALVLAYKRNFGPGLNMQVKIDPQTGKARVFADKTIVDPVVDAQTDISLKEALAVDPTAQVGGTVRVEMTPSNFGRIAAQTAKQVILQRIREAERETQYADWSDRVGEDVLGTIRNIDAAGNVVLSLGRAEAVMPRSEQIPTEHYSVNARLRTYIYEVERTSRGPRIKVSRSHQKLLRRLLENEVPEIFQGTVEIKAIAREPGSRSKVAVSATQAGVDPVGSCVGMRGVRIQNIVNELNGEKIDVVAWAPKETDFVANSLSPAKVEQVWLNEESKTATVVVPDNQLSLAIGKEGQNARLAAKLTGWRIDIKSVTESAGEAERRAQEAAAAAAQAAELAAKREAAAALLAEAERALAEEEKAAAAVEAATVAPVAGEPEPVHVPTEPEPLVAVPAVEAEP
ncbi:MAG TPA: transcription termination factor NusA, partial [Anaerolineae bacterium]|nr:transcription termination factor NusA [Anaerolineae bacterium]